MAQAGNGNYAKVAEEFGCHATIISRWVARLVAKSEMLQRAFKSTGFVGNDSLALNSALRVHLLNDNDWDDETMYLGLALSNKDAQDANSTISKTIDEVVECEQSFEVLYTPQNQTL